VTSEFWVDLFNIFKSVAVRNEDALSASVILSCWADTLFAFQTVKQMWPYVCQFVEKLFKGTIEPAIKEANAHLSTFSFTKIDLGDKVPLRNKNTMEFTAKYNVIYYMGWW